MNQTQILLRKIGGRFDACWRTAGMPNQVTPATSGVRGMSGLGALFSGLFLPLLLFVAVAGALLFGATAAHAHGLALAGGLAVVRRPERKDSDPATSGIANVKQAIEALATRFTEFKQANDERLAEIKAKGSADPLLVEKVEKLNAAVGELAALKSKIEELETKAARPQLVDSKGQPIRPEVLEHKAAFNKFMRKGTETGLRELEAKALSVGSAADGGYAVPEEIDRNIIALAISISPLRQLCNVISVGTSDYKKLVNKRGTASGWVGETDARGNTNTPQLAELAAFMGEIYANPQATQQMLDDVFFDAEKWLGEEVSTEFSYQENIAFTTGDGANKPKGFLAYATAAQNDAARAFGTIQYFATGQAAALRPSTAAANAADDLLDMIYSLKEAYRAGALFLMNSLTTAQFRKLKDQQGNYIWQPSMQAGQPDTIHGYGVRTAESMPDIAANTLPVAFANWKLAYTIVDRIGSRVLRDPFTNKPYVGFYTTKRVGGMLVNSQAIKLLKVAAA